MYLSAPYDCQKISTTAFYAEVNFKKNQKFRVIFLMCKAYKS